MAFQEDVEAKKSTGNWGVLDIQSALDVNRSCLMVLFQCCLVVMQVQNGPGPTQRQETNRPRASETPVTLPSRRVAMGPARNRSLRR